MPSANPVETGRLIYSVTQITREIKVVLESAFPQVWVEGEVSNFKLHSSGHMYFALKDAESVLNCAFFRGSNQGVKFQIKDGLKVLCFGRIGFYNKTGQAQLYVEKAEPKGVGELQLAFEQLKERLQKEGLFDQAHKRPIPMLPLKIGIVTSPTGAVIRDILHILRRRFNDIGILIYPVKVQGEGAAGQPGQQGRDQNGPGQQGPGGQSGVGFKAGQVEQYGGRCEIFPEIYELYRRENYPVQKIKPDPAHFSGGFAALPQEFRQIFGPYRAIVHRETGISLYPVGADAGRAQLRQGN